MRYLLPRKLEMGSKNSNNGMTGMKLPSTAQKYACCQLIPHPRAYGMAPRNSEMGNMAMRTVDSSLGMSLKTNTAVHSCVQPWSPIRGTKVQPQIFLFLIFGPFFSTHIRFWKAELPTGTINLPPSLS